MFRQGPNGRESHISSSATLTLQGCDSMVCVSLVFVWEGAEQWVGLLSLRAQTHSPCGM